MHGGGGGRRWVTKAVTVGGADGPLGDNRCWGAHRRWLAWGGRGHGCSRPWPQMPVAGHGRSWSRLVVATQGRGWPWSTIWLHLVVAWLRLVVAWIQLAVVVAAWL